MGANRLFDRRGFLSISAIGLLAVLSGCSDVDPEQQAGRDKSDERESKVVVQTDHHERTVNYFEASEGDHIEISVVNEAGSRTHALINGPDGGIVLSEGVLDEAAFTLTVEETGKYTVTMTPTDESASTSGTIRVVLTKREHTAERTEDANDSDSDPVDVVRKWVAARRERIDEAHSAFETALDTYNGHRYSESESQFATAEDVLEELLDGAARKATDHSRESELYQLFGSVSYYFSEMRDSSRYYTFAAQLRQRGEDAEHSAYGKDGNADFWEAEAERKYEGAQEARKTANDEIPGMDL